MGQFSFARPRLTIELLHLDRSGPDFAGDVFQGLSAFPKVMNPMYLYDESGSALFDRICELPEYYITRTEREILERCADEISGHCFGCARLAELGSGSSQKTRLLIEAFIRRQGSLCYTPVDISSAAVFESARRLIRAYPQLRVDALVGEYRDGISRLVKGDGGPKLLVFLGSTLGNFHPLEALSFLACIRGCMSGNDRFLLGNDLAKDESVLVPAYNDAEGVTAAFNLNLLARINRELGGSFDLSLFEHQAVYNRDEGRIEMHLRAGKTHAVPVRALKKWFRFEEGETIHTENSYKYSVEQLDDLFELVGFETVARWFDDRRWFSLSLLQ